MWVKIAIAATLIYLQTRPTNQKLLVDAYLTAVGLAEERGAPAPKILLAREWFERGITEGNTGHIQTAIAVLMCEDGA